MKSEFEGKNVLITGGSKGIGKACAHKFAELNANVFMCSRNINELRKCADMIQANTGLRPEIYQVDLGIESERVHMIEDIVTSNSSIDVLINNAAAFATHDTLDLTQDTWQAIFDVNVIAPFQCSQLVAMNAIKNNLSAVIINISSISSILTVPRRIVYSASKAALDSLTRSLALEWAQHNVRVNSVAPGHTSTEDILTSLDEGILDYEAITKPIPIKRLAKPEEIAKFITYLCSNDTQYITGQTIFFDGGRAINSYTG